MSESGSAEAGVERAVWAGTVLAVGALFLLLGYPMLRGQVYVDTDLGRYHLPLRHFHAATLARGESSLWCPYEWTGFHLHGEAQLGLYHPLNWLQFRLLPFTLAFNLEILRSYGFALLGAFFLLRHHRLGRAGALFGALCFTWSSFNVGYFMHPNFVLIAAHLPWLLLAINVTLCGSPRARALAWLFVALLCSSMLLLGHPQATWMVLVVGALYTVFLGFRASRAAAGILWVGVAVVVGFLLAGVQLLPQWESAQLSQRVTPAEGFTGSVALRPLDLVAQILAPHAPLEPLPRVPRQARLVHAGSGALVLAAWAILRFRRLPRGRRPLLLFAFGLAILGAVLAVGESGGLYRLQQLLPLVGLFRAPARYSLFVVFGLSVVSAVAVDDLVGGRGARETLTRPRRWLLALPLLASAAWLASAGVSVEAFGLTAVFVALYTGLLLGASLGVRIVLVALPLLLLADLGVHTWRGLRVGRAQPIALDALREREPAPDIAPGFRALRGPEHWIMSQVRLPGGYLSMAPKRVLPLRRPRLGRPRSVMRQALKLASVKTTRAPFPEPLPRARLVAEAVVGEVPGDLARLDVERVALVEERVALGGGPPGDARILHERPGDIELEIRSPTRQLLILSESYHRGWRAQVGDVPCPVLRVYGDFMGCVVEPGTHRVRFHFDPASLRVGKIVSAGGVLLAAVGTGLLLLRARRNQGASGAPARGVPSASR